MNKNTKTLYVLMAITLMTGSLLSGCADTSDMVSNTTPVSQNSTVSQSTVDTQTQTQPSVQSQSTVDTQAPTTQNKTATYRETVSYDSPGGTDEVTFQFVLNDGVVTDLGLLDSSSNPESGNYITRFMNGVKSKVIGKKLESLGTFSRISGASLTTAAFNEAVKKLKAEAKV